ncbi:MAG TPA: winged helix-turn-helix domain-containing protein [Caulobacteraceae bacterium]|jgi:predicted ATPase|nr:winged helix-turn-helix domain-containing protein [Caulobacteraceae bacterium]
MTAAVGAPARNEASPGQPDGADLRSQGGPDAPIGRESEPCLAFGAYQLAPRAGVLLDQGRRVRLGGRALEILTLLVEGRGEVIGYQDLIERAWPTTTVDESNLRVQIAGLRKALGDGHGHEEFIANVVGRGYRFVAPVTDVDAGVPRPAAAGNAPRPLTRIIGRADAMAMVCSRLGSEPLVTIVGAGGIGKTTLALAVVEALAPATAWFVDLASVRDPQLLAAAIASSLGLVALSSDPLDALKAQLRGRPTLLVLDNCEHLVAACATLAEALLKAAPDLRILATSREPLRAAGEWVCRLPPLEIPPADFATRAEGLSFASAQLFLERASSRADGLPFDRDTAAIVEICRRVDGIPLALELAAAAVGVFGVGGVAQLLGSRFDLLTQGRRTALPRHATLNATLDWSYQLLPEAEQRILRRLSVFSGAFTLQAAMAVAGDAPDDVGFLGALANLAEKSLLNVDLSGDHAVYRLLQMTRAYAAGKLDPDEAKETASRHASHFLDLLRDSEAAWRFEARAAWEKTYAGWLDDIRAGLDWAFGADGDLDLAVRLILESLPMWFRLSHVYEYSDRVRKALTAVRDRPDPDRRAEMRLLGAQGVVFNYTLGASPGTAAVWRALLPLAEAEADIPHQMLCAWGDCYVAYYEGRLGDAKRLAQRFGRLAEQLATADDLAQAALLRILPAFCVGEIAAAAREADRAFAFFDRREPPAGVIRFQFDPVVTVRGLRSRIFWLRGDYDAAAAEAAACVAQAREVGHTLSTTWAMLDGGAHTALLNGDLESAEAFIDEHARLSEAYGAGRRTFESNRAMRAVLEVARADGTARLEPILKALSPEPGNRFVLRFSAFVGRLAEALGELGAVEEGLAVIDAALTSFASEPGHWCRPELLRAQASLGLRRGGRQALQQACADLSAAYAQARRQGALAWMLRISITWAENAPDSEAAEARRRLGEVLAKAPTDTCSADVRRGRRLYESLARAGLRKT